MTDRDRDTWHTRDLHVLRAVADHDPRENNWASTICAEHLLELDALTDALRALEDGNYIEVFWDKRGGRYPSAARLRERGRRALGVWPSEEGVDGLLEALRQAEEATDDPDERSLLSRAGKALGGVSREVMTDVLAAVITKSSGLA